MKGCVIDKPECALFMGIMIPLRMLLAALAWVCVMMQSASAIILFGLGNSDNLTDPGTGVPFDGVARVFTTDGGNTRGSAVHLGGGYMLTANHVQVTAAQSFTFDGVVSYTLDAGFTPTQVAAGVDMKVFKLATTPTVAAASVYTGVGELAAPATLVGWGRGRLETVPLGSAVVAWGGTETIAKRWGLNVPKAADLIEYSYAGFDYSYQSIITVLGGQTDDPAGLGANEAAITQYDSGSGLFQYLGGQWYLIGIATTVETNGSSNFGDDDFEMAGGDLNFFARVGTYDSQILTLIPEPASGFLILSGVLLALRRSRH
jgi:hypothetical protein